MTPTERPGHLCPELLAFYGDDEGPKPSGYTLEQVLDWPDEDWELQHDFIQWLFATDEPSMFNPDAPVLDAATIARLSVPTQCCGIGFASLSTAGWRSAASSAPMTASPSTTRIRMCGSGRTTTG